MKLSLGIGIGLNPTRRTAQIISATIAPGVSGLIDGDTIASGLSEDIGETSNYTSAAGDIVSVDVSAVVSGEPVLDLNDTVIEGQTVQITVIVEDDQSKTRTWTASTTVQAGEVEPEAPVLEFVSWENDAKALFVSTSGAGDLLWSVTSDAVTDPTDVESGADASDFGSEAVDDGLSELELDLSETDPGEHKLNLVLKIGSEYSDVLTVDIDVPVPVAPWDSVQEVRFDNNSALSSIPLVYDTAPTEGNLMLAVIGTSPGQGVNAITPPAGWTLRAGNASAGRLWLYQKIAGASESDTHNFTISNERRWKAALFEFVPPGTIVARTAAEASQGAATSLTIGPTADTIGPGAFAIAAVVAQGNADITKAWTGGFESFGIFLTSGTTSNHTDMDIAFQITDSSGTLSTETGSANSADLIGFIVPFEEDV